MSSESIAEHFKKFDNKRREAVAALTLDQLLDPATANWFFPGDAGSDRNQSDLQMLQYKQIIETMRMSRLSTSLQASYTTLTKWIAVSAVVSAAATVLIAYKTLSQ